MATACHLHQAERRLIQEPNPLERGHALIELADVVSQLRQELNRARSAAAGEELRFDLGPIELEMTVGLEATGGAEAKVRFWVVELGGDAHATSTTTQRIKLTLNPAVGAPGNGAAAPPFISGRGLPGER